VAIVTGFFPSASATTSDDCVSLIESCTGRAGRSGGARCVLTAQHRGDNHATWQQVMKQEEPGHGGPIGPLDFRAAGRRGGARLRRQLRRVPPHWFGDPRPAAQQIQPLTKIDSHFTHSKVNTSQSTTQCGTITGCRFPQYGHCTVIHPFGNEHLGH
jgi:hypothetical protein